MSRDILLEDPPDDFSVYRYGKKEEYDFSKPRNVAALPTAIERKIGNQTVPAPFIVEMKNATAIGPSAIITANGKILLESVLGDYERLIDASGRAIVNGELPIDSRLQKPIEHYDEPVFSLVGPWATDYYHWMADYLIQIFAFEVYRDRTGHEPKVLIPADPPGWLRDSLELVGISPKQTMEWSGKRAKFSRLVMGSTRRHIESTNGGHIHSPKAMNRLGAKIRDTAIDSEEEADKNTRHLYVSRKDATDRRVVNEPELVGMLRSYDFKRIIPGKLTFAEQVRTFSNAEIIIGPHGAGLTNMIFATDATLIELFGKYENACYFTLSEGMDYNYVSVKSLQSGEDLIANISAIESLIKSLV